MPFDRVALKEMYLTMYDNLKMYQKERLSFALIHFQVIVNFSC